MLCSHCGREFSGGTVCPFCHSPQMASPTLEATRRVAGSPCMLLAALFFTLSFTLSLIRNVDTTRVHPLFLILVLVVSVPSLLFLIGIWRLFAAGRGRDSFFPTGGLTLVKAGVIVTIVYLGLAALFVISALLLGSAAVSFLLDHITTSDLGSLAGDLGLYSVDDILLLLMVIFSIAFAIVIVYFARIISTMGTVRRNLYTPVPSGKVSILVVVFNLLMALSAMIETFQQIARFASGYGMASSFVPDLIISLSEAMFFILFSICILQYRSQIGQLRASAYQAAYQAAYSQPGAPVQPPVYAAPGAPAEGQAAPQAAVQAPAAAPAAAVYCRQCGYPLTQQDVSCPRCGTPRG